MIDKKAIAKNKKIFQITNEKYNVFTTKLIEFLGEQFFEAPSESIGGNAFDGGLVDHIIKIAKYAATFNEILPEKIRLPKDSIMKVAFICEIGKTFLFKKNTSISTTNPYYDTIYLNMNMTVEERSIFYALSNGVMLTEDETYAILHKSNLLGKILKSAIEFAIMEESIPDTNARTEPTESK
jgi:hypothetical protein